MQWSVVTFNGYLCIINVVQMFLDCHVHSIGFILLKLLSFFWEATNVPLTYVIGKKDFVSLSFMVVMCS